VLRTPLLLNDVLQNVVDRLSRIAAQHTITITLEDASETLTVLAVEESLVRVFTNILENGIFYNTPNGSVTITLVRVHDTVRVDVVDTGVGMSDADTQRIFQRFYRADKSRSRRTGGSGLGLSISRAIIESFGGTITLKSAVDCGTTVSVTLPIHSTS